LPVNPDRFSSQGNNIIISRGKPDPSLLPARPPATPHTPTLKYCIMQPEIKFQSPGALAAKRRAIVIYACDIVIKESFPKKLSLQPRFDEGYLGKTLSSIFQARSIEIETALLPGDASTRRYFRVNFRKGTGESEPCSVIVMQLEEPAPGKDNDFTLLSRFLHSLELPVPELYFYDPSRGLIFLEDCGDVTLENRVMDSASEDVKTYYRKAVELLASMQTRATRNIRPDCPAYHLKFDVEKLMFEFDFMLEHFVDGTRKSTSSKSGHRGARVLFQAICEILAVQKPRFTHRDYHSRNLMVHAGKLFVLDFQDARMGPCQYDLASLLRDSYFELEESFVGEMIKLFIDIKQDQEGDVINAEHFREIFDLMSIQRNLKAVGTFAFQSVVQGNDRYLDCIPRTLGYVKNTFARHPELKSLQDSLAGIIPELEP